MSKKREYDEEYKVQAIKLAKNLGSAKAAAEELQIHVNTLYGWIQKVKTAKLTIELPFSDSPIYSRSYHRVSRSSMCFSSSMSNMMHLLFPHPEFLSLQFCLSYCCRSTDETVWIQETEPDRQLCIAVFPM